MTTIKLTNTSDEETGLIVTFTIENIDFGLEIEINITEPRMFTKQDYRDFLDAKRYDLTYCDSNGEVNIYWQGVNAVFTVSKYGAGGDGSINVKLPMAKLVEPIQQLIELLDKPIDDRAKAMDIQ